MTERLFEERIQKKLAKGKTKELLPVIKQFNSIAQIFIRSLTQKLEQEKAELSKIKVMVSGMRIPDSERNYSIRITSYDMNKTVVKRKDGSLGYNQSMNWEKDYKKRNKGFIL